MKRYNPKEIEPKWQQTWEKSGIYKATEDSTKPKRYVLEYFPYPSGAAMHVGHVRNYTIGDAVARFARMQGQNVLHPMGWDAFGLPAENFAIKNNISPKEAIAQNTTKFKQQLTQMGFSYDWSREIDSTDPAYYKWTQWFFKLLFDRGLAYQKDSLQWWCDTDKTVLANEQVEAGKCWRCGNEVVKKPLKQWFFKITDYADRLVDDLEKLDWSDSIKSMQRNWIGKSKGAEIDFKVAGSKESIRVFTTRPDTLYGATFMVLAPEHELVKKITTADQESGVAAYIRQSQAKSDIERQETNREKTGVFTGAYAVNPINNETIPVWIADYVLTGYGTGAIMAVPAHDERDNEFAKKFSLPIIQVVAPEFGTELENETYAEGGCAVVFDPKQQKYAFADIKGGRTVFFAGGLNKGEDVHEAVLREMREESGLHDVAMYEEVGVAYGHYRNELKNVNRRAKAVSLLVVLNSDDNIGQQLEDHEDHIVAWYDAKDVLDKWSDYSGSDFEHYVFFLKAAVARAIALGHDTVSDPNVFVPDFVSGEGILVNSGQYDGLASSVARERIVEDFSGKDSTFTETSGPSAVKPELPFVEREAITAIVKHWEEDKYLGLKWKKVDWDTFITGGVEGGQTAETAAMAEITEETGYRNMKLVKDLGQNHAKFYHVPKEENRWAHFSCLYFELQDGERDAVAEDEQAKHEVVWLSKEEVESFRLPDSHRQAWSRLWANSDQQPLQEKVNYKIRDWLISRQRYWGAPIPIIHCEKDGAVPVPEDQLPVELPEVESYQPTGEGTSVLASVSDWVNTTCPKCGGPAKRETDTMDGFACSSWYFLRFADPHNTEAPFSKEKAKFWLPVDDYIGGAEHAVMHLLYARMWTKVMFDAGLVDFDEPFKALRNQGMILAPDGRKMSKSWGNVIAPDEIIEQGYGADAIRLMELFIGPWNQEAAWSVEGMGGCFRFLQRAWTLVQEFIEAPQSTGDQKELIKTSHRITKKVSEDLHQMGFNTAIAALMEFTNELYKVKNKDGFTDTASWHTALKTFVQLLAPFAPHITEELWQDLGESESVHTSDWPIWDDSLLVEDSVNIVVQVNGKVRATILVAATATKDEVLQLAQQNQKVFSYIAGKDLKKAIYVPGKLVSLVV